jgi:hypothetical protein
LPGSQSHDADPFFFRRGEEAVDASSLTKVVKTDGAGKEKEKDEAPAEAEVVRYKKLEIIKKGNKTSFPRKGDMGKLSIIGISILEQCD